MQYQQGPCRSIVQRDLQLSRKVAEAEVGLERWCLLKSAGVCTLLANEVKSVQTVLVPTGVYVSRLGDRGGQWSLAAILFLEKCPKYPCPSSIHSD